MDKSVADRVASNDNDLANSLIADTINYNQANLASLANNLQPLLSGSVNRIVADSSHGFGNAIFERAFDPNRTIWAKAIGNNTSLDQHSSGLTGFNSNETGIIVGADTAMANNSLGVAVAYSQNDIDSKGFVNHNAKADTVMGFVYGNHHMDKTTAHVHIGAGVANIDGERRIAQTGLGNGRIAKSDYNINIIQAGLGISHQIGTPDRHITPFAKMEFTQSKSDGYTEAGADGYNLAVQKATYQSLKSTIGVRGHNAITPRLALKSMLSAGVDNGDVRSDIHAEFTDFANHGFTVTGHDIGKTFGAVGLGMTYKPKANTTLSLGYQGQWRKNHDNQGVVLGFEIKF
ncbi:autotransporter outer membrane beta-barrel domain-containing protein [Moraxella bovis]|uniref:autotransporter outer membrane beta-barrel domain-containing protein n=1 Tax=Moraxella bovis TaxID=476 RepID=UPI00222636A9|nr:autotransporter outer membrane beta-barrel domain-containing protein [Moraxella bovis]UZA49464.1 autotransporter outer membrane beta-barrel domain-containing protein [Moraxella bovis]